ncbi:helix-hairpin-helix domain-containing protein [Bacillus salacetis]|uniref:helix-hairpin-helix domain-containing protein n=1 Tax=Bacillus salacetis TaxID=2315464 RepID=UPI003B9DE29D
MLQTLMEKYKIVFITAIILLVSACALLYQYSSGSDSKSESFLPSVPQESSSVDEKEEETPDKDIFVDVKGAVRKPGIYKSVQNERVNDLIIRAGGFTTEAQEESVNLAQKVTDEMVIYVPLEGEESAAAPLELAEEKLLNINQAVEEDLDGLPGIGPAKAKAIIDYRTENGPFKSVEELKEVSGIGEATFERLKENITVD